MNKDLRKLLKQIAEVPNTYVTKKGVNYSDNHMSALRSKANNAFRMSKERENS